MKCRECETVLFQTDGSLCTECGCCDDCCVCWETKDGSAWKTRTDIQEEQ